MPRRRAFDSTHPLFEEFIRLRRGGSRIKDLVQLSYERGFPLSYKQVETGLSRAKYIRHLPDRVSHYFQNRVKEIGAKVDALETMYGLVTESTEKLVAAERDLQQPDLPISRKQFLEKFEERERQRLWGFCRDIVQLEITLGLRQVKQATFAGSPKVSSEQLSRDLDRQAAILAGLFTGGRVTVREIEVEGQSGSQVLLPAAPVDPVAMLTEYGISKVPGQVIVDEHGGEIPEVRPDEEEAT